MSVYECVCHYVGVFRIQNEAEGPNNHRVEAKDTGYLLVELDFCVRLKEENIFHIHGKTFSNNKSKEIRRERAKEKISKMIITIKQVNLERTINKENNGRDGKQRSMK